MMNKDKYIPQGYKPSPLGIIPEDWEVKRLGEICDIDKESLSSKTDPEYKFDYISLSDVDSDNFEISTSKQIFKKAPSRARRIVKKGDVIISTVRPNLQAFFLIKNNVENLIVSTGFAVLTPKKNVLGEYLIQYVFSDKVSRQFFQLVVGSNYPAVNSSDVAHLKLAIPHIKEQEKICNVLQLWDTAIAKQTALIEKLTLRKRGLMQQLLTGKKRLKGFSGEWERIKAGEIFKSISVKGNGSEVLLSATQEHGVIPRDQLESRVTMPTGDTNSFKLVEVGDFVISLRSFQGGLEYSEHRGIVSPAYTVLKPIVEIDKSFYRYYFKSAEFIGHLAIAVIGIRDGRQISYEDFCFVKIPYPNIKEQKAISSVLLQADKEIEIQKQKLAAMQEQKKGLMQVLLTGKRRIK